MAQDWEYNDEFWSAANVVHPVGKFHTDRAKAEEVCQKLCEEFLGGNSPQDCEINWDEFDLDPATATWEDLYEAGFEAPYFLMELEP